MVHISIEFLSIPIQRVLTEIRKKYCEICRVSFLTISGIRHPSLSLKMTKELRAIWSTKMADSSYLDGWKSLKLKMV